MHIALISAILFISIKFLLSKISIFQKRYHNYYDHKIAAFISIIGSTIYLIIAGMPVSGERALIMSGILLMGVIIDRKADILRSLAICASIILILQPESIFSASLQMSFSACLGLVVCYRSLDVVLIKKEQSKNPIKRVLLYLLNIVISTLAAGLATAPFIIYHFNQFSTYSVLANLICIPLNDFFIMPLGLLALLLMPFGLQFIPTFPMEFGIHMMIKITRIIAELPNSSIYLPSFSTAAILGIVLGGIFFAILKDNLKFLSAPMVLFALFSLFFYKPPNILLSESGNLFAIRIGDKIFFSSGTHERYVRKVWMSSLGVEDLNTISKLNSKECDKDFCLYKNNGMTAIIIKSNDKLDIGCTNVDLFINLSDDIFRCPYARYNINLHDLNRSGAHAIWFLQNNNINIKNVEEFRSH